MRSTADTYTTRPTHGFEANDAKLPSCPWKHCCARFPRDFRKDRPCPRAAKPEGRTWKGLAAETPASPAKPAIWQRMQACRSADNPCDHRAEPKAARNVGVVITGVTRKRRVTNQRSLNILFALALRTRRMSCRYCLKRPPSPRCRGQWRGGTQSKPTGHMPFSKAGASLSLKAKKALKCGSLGSSVHSPDEA